MTEEKQKRGRKRIFDEPLTSSQKKQRQRMKEAVLVRLAKENGYTPAIVLIADQHIQALKELCSQCGDEFSRSELDVHIFAALKQYLESDEELTVPKQSDWPKATVAEVIHILAKADFNAWEKQQHKEVNNGISET